jgi:hypothetical protein
MYMAGFIGTKSPQDAPPAPGLHTNDNQQVSGFVVGQLYSNLARSFRSQATRIGAARL